MTAQKGNILIPFLLGALLVATFLLWQSYQTKNTAQLPTSTPTPAPTFKDETANRKTFSNRTWNYSFKYPENLEVQGLNMGVPEENLEVLVVDPKDQEKTTLPLNYPYIKIYVSNNSTVDLQPFVKSSFEGNKDNIIWEIKTFSSGELSGWQYNFSGQDFNTTNSYGETQGGSGFMTKYPKKMKVIFLRNNNNIYTIFSAEISPFDQILSTFKFL